MPTVEVDLVALVVGYLVALLIPVLVVWTLLVVRYEEELDRLAAEAGDGGPARGPASPPSPGDRSPEDAGDAVPTMRAPRGQTLGPQGLPWPLPPSATEARTEAGGEPGIVRHPFPADFVGGEDATSGRASPAGEDEGGRRRGDRDGAGSDGHRSSTGT